MSASRLLAAAASGLAVAESSGALAAAPAPCDILESHGTPCVAAHSVARALYSKYDGPLYRVERGVENKTLDIGVVPGGAGVVDSASKDAFCADQWCVLTRIYDQSGHGNHLDRAPAGGAVKTPDRGVFMGTPNSEHGRLDRASIVDRKNGSRHLVYGARFEPGMGYRNDKTSGIPVGDEPETIYAVFDGRRYNDGCCFDYGQAETDNTDDGEGTMEAVYWGSNKQWASRGPGSGPRVMADLENGLWAGNESMNELNKPIVDADFVSAMVKGGGGDHFILKGGNTAEGGGLRLLYKGGRPNRKYMPMRKQGALILGIGGDNSDGAIGTFYEGAVARGISTDAADALLAADVAAAGYLRQGRGVGEQEAASTAAAGGPDVLMV